MRQPHRALALTLVLLAAAPAIASAGFGDYKNITGQITLWGPNRFGQQIAAAVGTEIAIMGREMLRANELDVVAAQLTSSPSALPTGAASGWAVVPGAVQDASGTMAVIRANGGTVVTVDTSQLDADARTWFTPGRGVTVVGVYRSDGVLAARGVATAGLD